MTSDPSLRSQVTESGLPATSRPQLVRSRTLPAIVVPGVGDPAAEAEEDDAEKKGKPADVNYTEA